MKILYNKTRYRRYNNNSCLELHFIKIQGLSTDFWPHFHVSADNQYSLRHYPAIGHQGPQGHQKEKLEGLRDWIGTEQQVGCGLSLPKSKGDTDECYECGDHDGREGVTWHSTAEILMDNLIGQDNRDIDTGEQRVIRQVAEVPPCIENMGLEDLIDKELDLQKMKSGNAPGPDNINPELIRKARRI